MYSMILLAALAQPAGPEPAVPIGMAPDQGLATIDAKGKLIIWRVTTSCFGAPSQEVELNAADKKETEKAKAKITNMMLSVVELPAKNVEAYTVDGKPIAAAKLAELLAKERVVLVALDGKKADPFHLQLYKEGTIVLVPPANVMGMDNGLQGPLPLPVPAPLPPFPPPDRKIPQGDTKP
jgi:hypothetical protein